MAERINNSRQGEMRRPHDPQTLSSRHINVDTGRDDDVIAALASARENRRARQVSEWERMHYRLRIST